MGKRLYRSSTNKIICGICGGIGEYLDLDPILIRVLWILFIGFSPILYLILVFIMPTD